MIWRVSFLFSFLFTLTVWNQATAITLEDDRGRIIQLKQPAQRVISLSPHLTELVYSAGAGSQLVGVVSYSDYPTQAKSLPLVGDVNRLNLEAILKLQPDLILGWKTGNSTQDIARLEQLGIPVFVTEIEKLEQIPEMIKRIGILTGRKQESTEQANLFQIQLKNILEKRPKKLPRRVFFEVWHQPLITLNQKHIISQIIQICGGINIFANATMIAPVVSLESVYKRNPEVIFLSGTLHQNQQITKFWQKNKNIDAGLKNRVYSLHPDTIERPTVRILTGLQEMCTFLNQVTD